MDVASFPGSDDAPVASAAFYSRGIGKCVLLRRLSRRRPDAVLIVPSCVATSPMGSMANRSIVCRDNYILLDCRRDLSDRECTRLNGLRDGDKAIRDMGIRDVVRRTSALAPRQIAILRET
jgi:hypothetical protein